MNSQQQPKLWSKKFIFLTLSSFLLFLSLQMLLSSFSLHVKGNLNAGDLEVSYVTSVFALSAIVARFLTAQWMKSWSRDFLLTAGLIAAAISTAISSIPETVAPLLVVRALYGLGFGMGSTIIPTLVSQIIPLKRMGEGIGYFGLSTTLALSIGPAVGMNVMQGAGFGTLTLMATISVALTFPLLYASRAYSLTSKPKLEKNSQSASGDSSWKNVFVAPVVLPALLNVLVAVTYSGLLSFIGVYGAELELPQVGLFFMFNAITVVLIRPISGKLFDKKGPVVVLIPSALFIIASMVLLSYTTSMGTLIISALCYGVGFGAAQPTIQAWMLLSLKREHHGAVNSMFFNATDVGIALGALLLGAIASMTSYKVMYLTSALAMVLFLVLFFITIKKLSSNKQ